MRVAVGEGVQSGAEHDDLTGTAGHRRGERVLGEPVPDRDEEPQPRRRGTSASTVTVAPRIRRASGSVKTAGRSRSACTARGAPHRRRSGWARRHAPAGQPGELLVDDRGSSLVKTGVGFSTVVPGSIGRDAHAGVPV